MVWHGITEVYMKRFNKRGTAVPFFTPIIALILAIILAIGVLIYQAVTYEEQEQTTVETVQE